MQYQAGYFLNSIFDLFLNRSGRDKVEQIVFQLAHFELDSTDDLMHGKVTHCSEIKVINNLIQRGIPTRPSTFIEDLLSTALGQTTRQLSDLNQINHPFTDDMLAEDIYKAIHIIDPRITIENQLIGEEEGAKATGIKGTRYNFKFSFFPEYLGHSFFQLIEENRDFESIINSTNIKESENLKLRYKKIADRNQDFVLEMPYFNQGGKGIALEFDDTPTETSYEFEIDQQREQLCATLGWAKPINIETHRISEINTQLRPLVDFTYNEYFDLIAKNFRSPLYKKSDGLTAMQYALSPIAIARIEKTLIEYLLSGKLSLTDKVWKIAVIERDVPCAYLAMQDLRLHFENLFALKGEKNKFPDIKLVIYRSQEFRHAKLNSIYPGEIKFIEEFDEKAAYDLLIDISVLQRTGLKNPPIQSKAKSIAKIRSVKSCASKTNILTDKAIGYLDYYSPKTAEKESEKAKNALKYFLRNIFRKDSFLSGQLELINQCLQRKNTLGVLPSGTGKSIAYQLSSILQAGLTFIVSPYDHLIVNQINALNKVGIDKTGTLCKTISEPKLQHHTKQKLNKQELQFVFISPDLLRDKEFRESLSVLEDEMVFVSQLIFDEAHCVSAWGHDFNPMYQNIGNIKDNIFKNPTRQYVPLLALTGTAGFSCIQDIQNEFGIKTKDIVLSDIKFSNPSFRLIDTTSSQIKYDMDFTLVQQVIESRKQIHFSTLINEIYPDDRISSRASDTLIYYPTDFTTNDSTIRKMAEKLSGLFPKLRIDYFIGNKLDGQQKASINEIRTSNTNSDKFLENELDLFISTFEYGIGSNKQDIRNLVYFCPPPSMEEFVQYTFRAGLDGKKFNCNIIIDKEEISIPKHSAIKKYLKTDKLPFDKYLAYNKLTTTYKGKEKEFAIIKQLCEGFEMEQLTYVEVIVREIYTNFQIDVELVFQPKESVKRVYVNQGEKTYGYVDLGDYEINSSESSYDQKLSKELLAFASDEIEKRIVKGEKQAQSLMVPIGTQNTNGIFKTVDAIPDGSSIEVSIPFSNNSLQLLNLELKKRFEGNYNQNVLSRIYHSCATAEDFITQIEHIVQTKFEDTLKKEITKYWLQFWNRYDCQLAIHRLGSLGIVDDYLIDTENQQFILKVNKQSPEKCYKNLTAQFDVFLLPENAAIAKKTLYKPEGLSILETIQAQIDFFYKYIFKYRIDSIESLHHIFSQIPENKANSEDINNSLNELMLRYFHAKFANTTFSLIKGSKPLMGKLPDFAMIKGFTENLGELKENWHQLRKSVELNIKLFPDHFLPYLLDAYANLVEGEKNEQLIDSAFDQIARGFNKIRKQKDYDRQKYQSEIQSFLDLLYLNRPDLKEKYNEVIWLRMHYMWLKDFNTKIH